MKKSLFNFLALACTILPLCSCDMLNLGGNQEMRIETTDYTLAPEGGVIEVKFVPVLAWTATCSENWLTCTPASGEASEEEVVMTVMISPNFTSKRIAEIVLSTAAGDVCITVVQKATDITEVIEQTAYEVSAAGGEIEIEFMPLADWTVECAEDWVDISPNSGTAASKKKTVTLTIDPNTGDARSATVKILFAGTAVEIKVNQAAGDPNNQTPPGNDDDQSSTEDVIIGDDIYVD